MAPSVHAWNYLAVVGACGVETDLESDVDDPAADPFATPGRKYYWASPNGSKTASCTSIDSTSIGSDPGSYGTIGQAARCARSAGDVVVVKAGTYSGADDKIDTAGNGNIDPGQFVSGTSDSVRTMIVGDPAGERPLIKRHGSFYCTYDTVERSYITLKNLEIDGDYSSGCSAGIQVSGHHVTIDDVNIHEFESSAISFTSSTGTDTSRAAFGVVRNSVIHDLRQSAGPGSGNGYCVYAQSTDITVEGNECYRAKGYGLHFYTGTPSRPDRATIRNNYIHDIRPATLDMCGGIVAYGTEHRIERNIIVNSRVSCPTGTVAELVSR